ncbi:MAG TPA: hypothetical protein VFE78_14095 [Gemmataceae bacterium]|jgi:hypothetical protein|nr:hypothetical protein [Gemmataceae bacterium]
MNLTVLNRLCWTICIVCILAGSALSLSMIWGTYQSEFLWKAWTSIAVLFFASAAALVVTKVVGVKSGAAARP